VDSKFALAPPDCGAGEECDVEEERDLPGFDGVGFMAGGGGREEQ